MCRRSKVLGPVLPMLRAIVSWWYYASWSRITSRNSSPSIARVDAEKGKRELLRALSRTSNTRALAIPEDAKIEALATLKGEILKMLAVSAFRGEVIGDKQNFPFYGVPVNCHLKSGVIAGLDRKAALINKYD